MSVLLKIPETIHCVAMWTWSVVFAKWLPQTFTFPKAAIITDTHPHDFNKAAFVFKYFFLHPKTVFPKKRVTALCFITIFGMILQMWKRNGKLPQSCLLPRSQRLTVWAAHLRLCLGSWPRAFPAAASPRRRGGLERRPVCWGPEPLNLRSLSSVGKHHQPSL